MEILATLMTKNEARFSELNIHDLPSDQFSYHLNKLMKLNLISKNESEKYIFTESGINFVAKVDHANASFEKQSLIVVLAICVRNNEKGEEEYLVHKRKKHPDFDFYSFPEGKTKFGSTLEENVLRELKEESGLSGKPTLKEISHILKYKGEKGNIVRDLLVYIYRIDEVEGELINTEEGENIWMNYEKYKSLEKVYSTGLQSLDLIGKVGVSITEDIIEIEN